MNDQNSMAFVDEASFHRRGTSPIGQAKKDLARLEGPNDSLDMRQAANEIMGIPPRDYTGHDSSAKLAHINSLDESEEHNLKEFLNMDRR